MTSLNTNLAELPVGTFRQLCDCLNANELWMKLLDGEKTNIYYLSSDEVERYARMADPAETLLRLWGTRGQTVQLFISRLQALSRVHRDLVDRPQLVLYRSFKAVKWARPEEVEISIISDGTEIKLVCKVIGFPYPRFQWLCNGMPMDGVNTDTLIIPRCQCSTTSNYQCKAWNEVVEGSPNSDHYRRRGKQYSSSLESKPVNIEPLIREDRICDQCQSAEYQKLCATVDSLNQAENEMPTTSRRINDISSIDLFATDKVALIISNCAYQNLPELVTPLCDAETLAQGLQDLKFKTVTLADLTLDEMQKIVKEYKKLLGSGVYAVLYFVGHGFEVNGQCYLLPVDAPEDAHTPESCVSMDWVLNVFNDQSPSLHLILLDVCRKFLPLESVKGFVDYAEQFKRRLRPNRNTVYGYSTSGGVGAYEVKGEINGVFMKYLKNQLPLNTSVLDMLNAVFRDIENDEKVRAVQIPELRSTLTQPRSLHDELIFDGHTISYDHHTIHWRLMHELPNPVIVRFPNVKLKATIFFDFCGHFTNKVYVYSSVGDLHLEDDIEDETPLSENARSHLALLTFPPFASLTKPRLLEDDEEGTSFCVLLSHLQRFKGEVTCSVQLCLKESPGEAVEIADAKLGHVLITRLGLLR
ncbi:unnamed protein product, partial [Mesorhabditis belari]|uniref:Mucosa-associated lymphoid tissue lymphoma translocation protein 1 n=1 Tax=Mesorhabditis belari TaxID=2138241 RepID=A0AAF3F7J5_9BILA